MCGNYSREETIQGRKLFAEIRYLEKGGPKFMFYLLGRVFLICKTLRVASSSTGSIDYNEMLDFLVLLIRDMMVELEIVCITAKPYFL
jgi:hypothetical protein